MNCYECATRGTDQSAVALCRHCFIGLCLAHVAEAKRPGPGGLQLGCPHGLPTPAPRGGARKRIRAGWSLKLPTTPAFRPVKAR